MSNFKNAAPRMVFEGLRDVSGRAVPNVPLAIPTHLPLVFIRSGWGLEVDQLVSGAQWFNLYGDDVFSERSPYFTHQNLYASRMNAKANKQLAVRIVPEDAPAAAGFRHCIEYVKDSIEQYERNDDGTYKVGSDGQKVPTGSPLTGYRLRHFIETISDPADGSIIPMGQASERTGEMVSTLDDSAGTIVPIQEWRRPCRGKRGNLGGMRLFAATTQSAGGTRDDLIERERGLLFRLQMVERADERSSAITKATVNGAPSILFSYKGDFFDKKTEVEYGIDQIVKQSYNLDSTNGGPATVGVFSDYHVYNDNLENLLGLIQAEEFVHGTVGNSVEIEGETVGDPLDLHLVNFLGAVSWTGVPYYTVKLESPTDGGLYFNETAVHYALGGGDGTMTDESFDKGVADFIRSIPDNELRLWDPYRVPASVVYDSGFSLETKFEMLSLLGIRDDIWLAMQTQVSGEPLNSEEEDYSIGVALKNRALAYPESTVYGTESLRAQIISGAGTRNDSKLRYPISLNLKVAEDFSAYMGADNAIWDSKASPDEPENNGVLNYTKTNIRSKNDKVVDDFWDAGIVWAQYRDRAEIFIPAYQTVYPDDTSVLNSTMNMIIAVDVIKQCRWVWTQLTGRTKLTKDQLLERCNRMLAERLALRYDSRIRVVVNAYLTATDDQLGYAWHADVHLFMNNMMTVGQFSVIAHRMDELVTFDLATAA